MRTIHITRERDYLSGSIRYYKWYDAYSYTDYERNVMVFHPVPLNIIVAFGRWCKWKMFKLLDLLETERTRMYANVLSDYTRAQYKDGYIKGYDVGMVKGRDLEFCTAQDHAKGMAKLGIKIPENEVFNMTNQQLQNPPQGTPFNRDFYNLVNADVIENKRKMLEKQNIATTNLLPNHDKE